MKISPPAFPTYLAENMAHGMTLRDYFAAVALPEIMRENFSIPSEDELSLNLEQAVRLAYYYSDAMLKVRDEC
jgi:hypothetical protein